MESEQFKSVQFGCPTSKGGGRVRRGKWTVYTMEGELREARILLDLVSLGSILFPNEQIKHLSETTAVLLTLPRSQCVAQTSLVCVVVVFSY